MLRLFIFFFISLFSVCLAAQSEQESWVDSVYQSLSLKERIGQLMMIRAHSDKGPEHQQKIESQIEEFGIGGLCFFQGTPEKQAELTNLFQAKSKFPLMVSMDAEWGLGMRLKEDAISFPKQLTLGAIQDNRLIYDMGKEIARQLRRLGVHINFAPVADINNNPKNPVINYRSFGEDRFQVSTKSYLYMKGMQDANVMACAKHFPGHGDTDVDSHEDLPIIKHSRRRLDSLELLPFKILVEKGIQSVMVAHLAVPSIDPTSKLPMTLSPLAVNELLRTEMGFKGLIFTDGLGMKGVTKYHNPGEVEAKALVAGNDVLLLPQDVKAAFSAILKFLKEGKLTESRLISAVKNVLRAKYQLGLTERPKPIELKNIRPELNSIEAKKIIRKLYEQSLTLVRNGDAVLPLKDVINKKMASLSLGTNQSTSFQNRLRDYKSMDHFQLSRPLSKESSKNILSKLVNKDLVFVSLHDMSSRASKNFSLSPEELSLLAALNASTKVVLTIFGNPYSLRYFDKFNNVLMAYEDDPVCQDVAAQALFGALPMNGLLPITASPISTARTGVQTQSLKRIGYNFPEAVGLNSNILNRIDSLAKDAIKKKATPGCVVMVVKDGNIVFEKGYGYHTYAKKKKVKSDDIYDLASITKILSGTLSTMKLYEEEKINIEGPLRECLPSCKGTNKEKLILKDIMSHRAGLKSWIKFYESTLSNTGYPLEEYYKKRKSPGFTVPVTERLFLKGNYKDTLEKKIFASELQEEITYRYSDLGFYLIADMVKAQSKLSIDEFVEKTFFQPMGLENIGYNPWQFTSLDRVPPTEVDKYFRKQTIWGYVHDMGSAMLGGVGGHAGLFGSAKNVAELMQMLLNNGYYAGQQYLEGTTIEKFTQRHPDGTRRGIGFDMKELDSEKTLNMCASASSLTYGHLGFTGTATWADPKHNVIYVFLANRTYPSMHNYLLNKEDYRPKIQEVIYDALEREPS